MHLSHNVLANERARSASRWTWACWFQGKWNAELKSDQVRFALDSCGYVSSRNPSMLGRVYLHRCKMVQVILISYDIIFYIIYFMLVYDDFRCAYIYIYIWSRFAVRYHPPPPWYGPKTCVLQHSAWKRGICSVSCTVGGWRGPQTCKFVGFPATNLPKTCYLQCFGFDIVE